MPNAICDISLRSAWGGDEWIWWYEEGSNTSERDLHARFSCLARTHQNKVRRTSHGGSRTFKDIFRCSCSTRTLTPAVFSNIYLAAHMQGLLKMPRAPQNIFPTYLIPSQTATPNSFVPTRTTRTTTYKLSACTRGTADYEAKKKKSDERNERRCRRG